MPPAPSPTGSCEAAKERDCPGLSGDECISCMARSLGDKLTEICPTRADIEVACSGGPKPTPAPTPTPTGSCKTAKQRDCPGLVGDACKSCMARTFKDKLTM